MEVRTPTNVATVAVVDENVWRVRHLSEVLQAGGHRVLLVTSSTQALGLLSDGKCDVVLAAEKLSGTTGSAMALALREKLGAKRPWLVLLRESAADVGSDVSDGFDVNVARPTDDAQLMLLTADAIASRRALTPPPAEVVAPAAAAPEPA